MNAVFFYLLAIFILGFSVIAVTNSNLLTSALYLALAFFTVGGLFFLMGSPFLGVLQILINAGAIPIVTVFIIFMTQSRITKLKSPLNAGAALLGIVPIAVALVVFLVRYAGYANTNGLGIDAGIGNIQDAVTSSSKLGELLVLPTGALMAFEIASVVLLVAMVGAIVLTKRDGETIKGEVLTGPVTSSVATGEGEHA